MSESKGDILVISGISGAGKSVLSESLREFLVSRGRRVAVLDGDSMRSFFRGELKYSAEERLMVSKTLAYGAHLLSENGIDVILATMLSQPGARDFLKSTLKIHEVFLDAVFDTCAGKDCKGVYEENLSKDKPNIVGYDLDMERPENPDIVIKTHIETPEQSLERIIDFLRVKELFGLKR